MAAGAPLVAALGQGRLSMELASLFSHGAAAPAAALLWRFRLLDALLPLHAEHMQRAKAARKPRWVLWGHAAAVRGCTSGHCSPL